MTIKTLNKKVETLVFQRFAPKFSLVDCGCRSGRIIMRDDYHRIMTFWNKMGYLEADLSLLVDGDILELEVRSTTDVSTDGLHDIKFTITFLFDGKDIG